jgi:hypothetical protein
MFFTVHSVARDVHGLFKRQAQATLISRSPLASLHTLSNNGVGPSCSGMCPRNCSGMSPRSHGSSDSTMRAYGRSIGVLGRCNEVCPVRSVVVVVQATGSQHDL